MVSRVRAELERFEPALVGLVLMLLFVARISSVPFHPDESQWIYSSVAFEKFVKLQWSSPVFRESYWTLTQPPLTRYIIGLGRRMGGYTVVNNPWRFHQDPESNVAGGAMPSPGLLWWSRAPMAVLAALSCWACYLWLRRAFGRLAGWVWVAECLLSAYLSKTLGKAMGEAPLVAAVTAAAWAGQRALSRQGRRDGLAWFLAFGLLAGTAGTAKLNGLVLAGCGVILAAATAHVGPGAARTRTAFWGAASLLLIAGTLVAFVAWNPFLYRNPFTRGLKMLEHRVAEMEQQVTDYPHAEMPEGWDRLARVIGNLAGKDSPLPIAALPPVHLTLALIGLLRLGGACYRWLVGREQDPIALTMMVVWGLGGVPALLTRLDWQRYLVLAELFFMMLLAIGFDWVARLVAQRRQQRRAVV